MSQRNYVCPGEQQAISRSVHLARLAADYAPCANCPHREDLGGIQPPDPTVRHEAPDAPLFQTDRVWRSLRHAGARRAVLDAVAATGAVLWKQTPWDLPLNDWDAADSRVPAGPLIVVADDGSVDGRSFAVDAVRELSRGGSRVLTIGSVIRPVLDFGITHLKASAGLYILGGGTPSGVGFTVSGPDGCPWSLGSSLDPVTRLMDAPIPRPSRTAGSVRGLDLLPAYCESLIKHFPEGHAPAIATAGLTTGLAKVWNSLSDRVQCQLVPVPGLPRCDSVPSPALLKGLQAEVVQKRMAGGIIFGQDDQQLGVLDRREGLLAHKEVCRRVADEYRRAHALRRMKLVVAESAMWLDLNVPGVDLIFSGPTPENVVHTMLQCDARIGSDGTGRLWILENTPRCDPMLTLAYIARHWARTQSNG